MGGKSSLLIFGLAVLYLLGLGHAFQISQSVRKDDSSFMKHGGHSRCIGISCKPVSASRRFMAGSNSQGSKSTSEDNVRDHLRKVTGFSLTAFRAAWRAATGISLTAIYATALAASGLWIRKITSVVLSVFPAWFRYFLQPILIAYYLPIFVVRGLTGPTRKEAKARHQAVKESLRDAMEFAKKTKSDGYWPVEVNENGDFELISPPHPQQSGRENLADAVAKSVEQAMEQGYKPEKKTSASFVLLCCWLVYIVPLNLSILGGYLDDWCNVTHS